MNYRFFYNYIHFRVNKLVKRNNEGGLFGIFILTTAHLFLFLGFCFLGIRLLLGRDLLLEQLKTYSKFLIFIPVILFGYLNYRSHYNREEEYTQHWQNEKKIVRLGKGLLSFIIVILHFFLCFLMVNAAVK